MAISGVQARKLVRAVDNAIRDYLNGTTFGWASTLTFSSYSGEDGKERAENFRSKLKNMSDLGIMERCLQIFDESYALSRHIVSHLVMCGIWYDKIDERLVYDGEYYGAAFKALTKVLKIEVEEMKRRYVAYYYHY